MELDDKRVGLRVKKRRKELKLTQERLAEHCDVSSTYISHIETGIAKVSLEVLYKISVALKTTPDYFLVDSTKAPAYTKGELSHLLDRCDNDTLYLARKLIETLVEARNGS